MRRPKLKDSQNRKSVELYPLGSFPEDVICQIGKWLVYYYAIGKADISGEDWGDIFAKAIEGEHLPQPVGLADVVHEGQAWSVKTVKQSNPYECRKVRLISGRNSPDYSYGIQNPREDVQKTGSAVLGIWNDRVGIALDNYDSIRTVILVRNFNKLEFVLFENETRRYATNAFEWKENKNGNFEAYDTTSDEHRFTWQPHGSQFTVIEKVPVSGMRFTIKRPSVVGMEETLTRIGYDDSWITITRTVSPD